MGDWIAYGRGRVDGKAGESAAAQNSAGPHCLLYEPVTAMAITHRFPSSFKALVLQNKREQQNKSLYHDVRIVEGSIPALKPGEILVKINAAGFNYREVCSRITQTMGGRCGNLSRHN